MTNHDFLWLVEWVMTSRVGNAVLLSLQLGAVALVATLLSRPILKWDASCTFQVWLAAVIIALVLTPVSLLQLGWQVTISRPMAQSPSLSSRSSDLPTSETESVQGSASFASPSTVRDVPTTTLSVEKTASTSMQAAGELVANSAATSKPISSSWRWPKWREVIFGIYLCGLTVYTARLCISLARLRSRVRETIVADERTLIESHELAQVIGLAKVPSIRLGEQIPIPMVVGVWSPVVLLPEDFRKWTDNERRSSLLHEMTHLKRRDTAARMLAVLNCIIYWFHPASHWLRHRLAESSEWATDRDVLQASSRVGLSGLSYAESLISVVARSSRRTDHAVRLDPVVAMSAHGDLGTRLKLIAKNDAARSRPIGVILFAFVLFSVLLTARLQFAAAQTNEETKEVDRAKSAFEMQIEDIKPVDHDLFALIENASVAEPPETNEDTFRIDLAGTVLDENDRPVVDALVVLRDIRVDNLPYQAVQSDSDEKLQLGRFEDVIARTTTDSDGRYKFSQVEARWPQLGPFEARWRGDVIAAHQAAGVAWRPLEQRKKQPKRFADASLSLRPPVSLSGTYVSKDGDPIEDALVSLIVVSPGHDASATQNLMNLLFSSLTPRTRTDALGRFQFEHLPKSSFARLRLTSPKTGYLIQSIATSDDIDVDLAREATSVQGGVHRSIGKQLKASPAMIEADDNVVIQAKVVDDNLEPVSGCIVYTNSARVYRTDRQGVAEIILPRLFLEDNRMRHGDEGTPLNFYATSTASALLPGRTSQLPSQLINNRSFTIKLEPACSVRGKVVDSKGNPLKGINVCAPGLPDSVSGVSGRDGEFELRVSAGTHDVVFCANETGFNLPTRLDVLNSFTDTFTVKRNVIVAKGRSVQLSEPVVITRAGSFQLVVLLPDGSPAAGVSAIVRQEQKGATPNALVRTVNRSEPLKTDDLGRVSIVTNGVLTESARIDLTYLSSGRGYRTLLNVRDLVDGAHTVTLTEAPILEGRVTVDGKGIQGAMVGVGEFIQVGGRATTTNFVSLQTDGDGFYRTPVVAGRLYQTQVDAGPNANTFEAFGYQVTAPQKGTVRVADYSFTMGDQVIAGTVVDEKGEPVEGARLRFRIRAGNQPNRWVGHREASRAITDSEGRFRLAKVPRGSYQISVTGKQSNDRSARPPSTLVTATAGDENMTITLAGGSNPKAPPRLTPIRIESIDSKP
ncbi:MAG: M56 family metallopeptidase [Planctomycetota bacterium]